MDRTVRDFLCKDRLFYFLLLVVIGVFSQSQTLAFDRPLVESFGARRINNDVQLVFEVTRWPKRFEGFHLMRRKSKDEKETWVRLTKRPLLPRPFSKIDWDRDFGLSDSRAQKLKKWFDSLGADQKILSEYENDELFSELPGTREGRQVYSMAYHTSRGSGEFRNFLIHGVGFIDVNAAKGTSYEYALFEVYDDKTKSTPTIVCRLDPTRDVSEIKLNITHCETIGGKEGGIWIKWEVPDEYCRRFNFDSCRLYRARIVGTLVFKKIHDAPGYMGLGRSRVNRSFFLQDRPHTTGGDPDKAYVYKIVPVNYFKEELPVSWRVEYNPKEEKDKE